MGFRQQADKVGILGATFAALCCLGISAVLGAVSAVGLGFLINDAVLLPMLIAFLALTILGTGIRVALASSPRCAHPRRDRGGRAPGQLVLYPPA